MIYADPSYTGSEPTYAQREFISTTRDGGRDATMSDVAAAGPLHGLRRTAVRARLESEYRCLDAEWPGTAGGWCTPARRRWIWRRRPRPDRQRDGGLLAEDTVLASIA